MIVINLEKAKAIGHDIRRTKRAEEFAPHDEVIAKQIPGQAQQDAEIARQKIRDKYALMQEQIDSARSADEIKAVISA